MPNHLQFENSPYLLQHKDNPVDWYPWGEIALQKAKQEQKPIFLSIGYAACHWCHVMAHESFENTTTAAMLNHDFIAIKVDREERPDLDHIYMQAVQAMTGSGGWPMSVFLTPEGKPFWGGTYFPPVPRQNMPSFNQVLGGIAEAWQNDRDAILQSGENFSQKLYGKQETSQQNAQPQLSQENLRSAVTRVEEGYDWQHGGWGSAPKFPLPVRLLFLLQQAADGKSESLKLAEHALNAMAQGGMVDVVGGGFARYSTDARWLVPHFEKMLYDNALLARAYLYAFILTRNEEYHRVCDETLRFVQREMTLPEGGFISSIDADSEGGEGKFYVWSDAEIDEVLSNPDDNLLLRTVYHISVHGNFEGHNILQRMRPLPEAAERLSLTLDELHHRLDAIHQSLYAAREKRVHPHKDDKVLVSWNAMMLQTFAEAARYLHEPAYLKSAQRNAEFLLTHMIPEKQLLRSWREGSAHLSAYLEDYAAFILALLELYQDDHNTHWYSTARQLTDDMLASFYEPEDGFYDTRNNHEALITRPKDLQDNATPCGSSQAVLSLLRMAAFSGRSDWYDLAVNTIQDQAALITAYPTAFSNWLSAYAIALADRQEIAILGDPQDPSTQAMLDAIWDTYRPFQVSAVSVDPPTPDSPELLHDHHSLNSVPTAYVCQHHTCQPPVTSVEELRRLIDWAEHP